MFGDLGRPNSLHAFGYGNGNPLSFIDPLGEASRKVYFRQEIEALPRDVREAVLAQIDPVLAKADYLGDLSKFSDEQLLAGICSNLDAACDESGAEWLWEQGRRKLGPGLQAFADRVSQTPAADAVRAIRAKAAEVDESLRDTATGTYRQALGPTANVIANRLPADAAPQVLAQTQAMSRNLGDATVDAGEEAAKYYVMGAVLKGGGAALEARAARAEARAAERQIERAAAGAGDEFVSFYHATSREGAASLRAKGIDLSFSRPRTDFGRGFYTTTDRGQALRWAERIGGAEGQVLEFRVPRGALGELKGLDVGSLTPPSLGRFVRHNRLGGRLHSYDLVEGPMLGNPGAFLRGQPPRLFGQQTSFHSEQALRLLDRSLVP